jgi:uncharacterized protein (TIGR02117 family)
MRRNRASEIGAAALLMLLLVTVATAKSSDPSLYPPKAGDAVVIYLIDNGFHSDLAVPRVAILAHGGPIAAAAARTSPDPWIMIGWGDAKFYEATSDWQGRVPDALRAAFGGRPTVVHLQGVWESPDKAWRTGTRAIPVSAAGLNALLARADRAFVLRPDGGPIFVPSQHDPGEAFFRSGEDFSLVHLCNHWTGELLSAAGLPTTPVLDTLPAGLRLDLQLRAGL